MAAISTHRPLSHYFFPPSPSHLPPEGRPIPRTRSITGHYRPVSQLLSEEPESPPPHPSATGSIKLRRKGSVQLFTSLNNHSLLEMVHKPKDRRGGKEARIRKMSSNASIKTAPRSPKDLPVHHRSGIMNKGSWNPPDNVIDISSRNEEDDVTCRTADEYVKKKIWHRRDNMRMHPYPDDAIYMQSYDPIMLENEKYSYLLLRRLTSSIPTFSTSMDKPPSAVLDLGCGQGHWLLDASTIWTSTDFTGFDLVDVMLLEAHQKSNIRLVRGNFVKYPLPFPDKSFDFVRMANLSLTIPHDKWNFVFAEVRRVLRVGGQLELIDDQLYFPYGQAPVPYSPSYNCSEAPPLLDARTVNSNDEDAAHGTSSSTLGNRDTLNTDSMEGNAVEASTEIAWTTAMASQRYSMVYVQRWASNYRLAKDVEDTFVNMLRRLSVHPNPTEFLPDLLRYTFGGGNTSNTQTYHIKLPCNSSIQPSLTDEQRKSSLDSLSGCSSKDTIEFTGQSGSKGSLENDRGCPARSAYPLGHSAKAAGRLGISYSDLVAATEASKRHPDCSRMLSYHLTPTHGVGKPRGSTQSPGIIISPSTFIPLTPIETEFHACKWIHTVLGCKPAIKSYVRSFIDEDGQEVVDDAELGDALWIYESFRRQRFHWPTDPERDHESFASPCISNTDKLDFRRITRNQPDLGDNSVHIRTIQVYHATKTEMTSLSSLLFTPAAALSPSSNH